MPSTRSNQVLWLVVVGVLIYCHCYVDAQIQNNRNTSGRRQRNIRNTGQQVKYNQSVSNRLDPDETRSYSASHLDPNCLQKGQGLPPHLRQAYREAMSGDVSTLAPGATTLAQNQPGDSNQLDTWRGFTPSLPGPGEVECHVPVASTVSHGGRCVRLGGVFGHYACQSGALLEMTAACRSVVEDREQAAAEAEAAAAAAAAAAEEASKK